MAIKFFSDILNKPFDSEAEANAAEKEYNDAIAAKKAAAEAKSQARKDAAKAVEDKRAAMIEARKAYEAELTAFCEKYGAYHTSYTVSDLRDIFDDGFLDLDLGWPRFRI